MIVPLAVEISYASTINTAHAMVSEIDRGVVW